MTDTTPVQRAQIKASLYLMDTLSYIQNAMSSLEGRPECQGAQASTCSKVWNGNDPAASNLPTYLNPNIRSSLPQYFTGLPANPSESAIENALLSSDNDNTDLTSALQTLTASNLAAAKKAKAIAAFYLIDVVRYIASAMNALGNEPECKAGAGSTPESVQVCDNIWSGALPDQNIPVQITPNATTVSTLFRLAQSISPAQLQGQLESRYLTSPTSNTDLQIALCNVNAAGAICPAISGTNAVDPGEQGREITMTVTLGNNIPAGEIKVEVLLYGNPDPTIAVVPGSVALSADKTKITFRVNVASGDNVPVDNMSTPDQHENARTVRVSVGGNVLAFELADSLTVNGPVAPTPTLHANCADGLDNDHDGKIDAADVEDCNPASPAPNGESTQPPRPTLTDWQLMSLLVHDTYKLYAEVGGGYGSPIDTSLPLRAAADRPNLILNFGLGTRDNPVYIFGPNSSTSVFGPQHSIAGNSALRWLEILGYLQGSYEGFYHLDGHDDTNRGRANLGMIFRFAPFKQYNAFGDVYFDFGLNGANYQYANRAYPTGLSYGPTTGLALGSDFTTNWILGRAFGEYSWSRFDWNRETLSQPFSGDTQRARTGLELTLNFSKLASNPNAGASRWIPDLKLTGAYTPWGRVDVPNFWPVAVPNSYENIRGADASLTLKFNNAPWQPSLSGTFQRFEQEGWDPSQGYSVTAGARFPYVGRVDATFAQSQNVSLFYGGDVTSARLRWTLPNEWGWDRLEAFSIQPEYYNFNGQNGGGVIGLVDVSKLIWPIVTQPAQQK